MLFSQHNGLAQAVGDDTISQLQELACGIGPQVDGMIASVIQPQAMGAFSTSGAAGACAMRGQQAEQHQPTTMSRRGFGGAMGLSVNPALVASVAARNQMTLMPSLMPSGSYQTPPSPPSYIDPTTNPYGPETPLPTTMSYPAGTITAFSSKTNMWRVAVPTVAAGLGMFGAAAPFTEIAAVASPPPSATQVSELQLEKQTGQLPIWKKWQFWAAVGGGVFVVGTGTALLFRRKRAA